jgi:hypothetical protein
MPVQWLQNLKTFRNTKGLEDEKFNYVSAQPQRNLDKVSGVNLMRKKLDKTSKTYSKSDAQSLSIYKRAINTVTDFKSTKRF